jgi:hypothetical protein
VFDQKEFKVQLIVTTAHEYVVTARTDEEAISIAEGMLDDGEEGFILSSDVDNADAYPYTDQGDDDEEED